MEKRGSTSMTALPELVKYASDAEAAVIINCDSIKRGSVAVFATGDYSRLLGNVLSETDVFEKHAANTPRDLKKMIYQAAQEDGLVVFKLDHIEKDAVAVVATGPYAVRLKRSMDRADAIAREEK